MFGIIKSNSESTTNEIYRDLSKFKIIGTTKRRKHLYTCITVKNRIRLSSSLTRLYQN